MHRKCTVRNDGKGRILGAGLHATFPIGAARQPSRAVYSSFVAEHTKEATLQGVARLLHDDGFGPG